MFMNDPIRGTRTCQRPLLELLACFLRNFQRRRQPFTRGNTSLAQVLGPGA
jgi:hypothetical protein